ncbi:MAG: SDR family NAD(P)-dependent oxidoreductase [Solirubrobacterales bacterium]
MNDRERPLSGSVVVVTGGTGGIGLATGRSLVAAGARVALGDLDGERAASEAAALGEGNFGGRLDVTDISVFESFVDQVEAELGPVDALVNNAGVMILGGLDDESEEATERSIQVNLYGVINGTKIAMRRMKRRGSGQIVNIASQAGKTGFPGGSTYCATKFAVVGLCESVRNELTGTGVGVTCVMPGPVKTELATGIGNARGVRWLLPSEVGDGITRAIVTGQAEVWLPRSTRFLQPPTSLLSATARDRLMRVFNADNVLAHKETDPGRIAYEEKALKKG